MSAHVYKRTRGEPLPRQRLPRGDGVFQGAYAANFDLELVAGVEPSWRVHVDGGPRRTL